MGAEVAATRSHNEGTLFERGKAKRKPGEKPVFVSAVTMRDGRRASRTTHSRDDAKAALAELLRLRDAGAPTTGRIRLGDFLERWVSDDHGWSPATARKHRSIVDTHLVPALGFTRLSELSVVGVENAIARRPVGPRSQAHVRATLRRALTDAIRDGLVQRNVAGLARPVRQPHRERTILDAAQARLLIESTRGTRYGPLWTILVTTGLRISEALGLAWSDVELGGNDGDLRDQRLRAGRDAQAVGRDVRGPALRGALGTSPSITVRHQLAREDGEWVRRPPKTAKGRKTIPLTPLGVDALRAQREQQREWRFGDVHSDQPDGRVVGKLSGPSGVPAVDAPVTARFDYGGLTPARPHPVPIDGLVFTSPTGHPLHETNTLKALYADLAAAGLPRVSQHSLRHAAATILFSMGLPIEAIADMLGHSTVRITQDLYRHSVQSFSVLAAERMQEALG